MSDDALYTPKLSVIIATHNNVAVLQRCIESWRRFAADQPVELIVVDDGCTDGTDAFLRAAMATTWQCATLRSVRVENVHELMCTNRGFREARGPLIMSWHDDMFLQAAWFVPELIATFAAYPTVGLLSLSRGLYCLPRTEPLKTWEDSIDWRYLRSTIGPAPFNWLRLHEVDAVMRPWVVRRACLDVVGPLDEIFRPTEWDEADLCYRIRRAGWQVATHGFERDGAYEHLLSTTFGRTPSEIRQATGLRNALIFHERWDETIRRESVRRRRVWWRRMSSAGIVGTIRADHARASSPIRTRRMKAWLKRLLRVTLALRRLLLQLDIPSRAVWIVVGALFVASLLEWLGIGLLIPLFSLMVNPETMQSGTVKPMQHLFPGHGRAFYVALFAGLVVASTALKNIFAYWTSVRSARLQRNMTIQLRARLYARLQRAPLSVFERSSAGALASLFGQETQRTVTALGAVFALILLMLMTIIYATTLLYWSLPLGICAFGIGVLLVAIVNRYYRRLEGVGHEVTDRQPRNSPVV